MKNFSRICAAVSVVGLLLLLTAATSVPSAAMRYTFYTTNTTADIDAHIGSITSVSAIQRSSGFGTNTILLDASGIVSFDARHHRFANTAGFAVIDLEQGTISYPGGNTLINLNSGAILSSDGGVAMDADGRILRDENGAVILDFHNPAAMADSIAAVGISGVYGGTGAARDAFTPSSSYALWIVTDSVPPYQLSVWANGAWN